MKENWESSKFQEQLFTKVTVFVLCVSLFVSDPFVAGALVTWQVLGNGGFSNQTASYTSIAISPSGTPYVVYSDNGLGDKAVVKMYDGMGWVNVGGSSISVGGAYYTNIKFNSSGTPYVAYQDGNIGGATVQFYDGSSWNTVGTRGFTAGVATDISLALDASSTPYVAFRDASISGRASVMKFDGSNWVGLGAGASSGGDGSNSLVFDSSNTPYLSFNDNGHFGTAVKFDGSSWVMVGGTHFDGGQIAATSLALSSNGTPYVAYTNASNILTVKKFDGSNWVTVGSSGFSGSTAFFLSLALDASDTPYVAFVDGGNSAKSSVMKFDGSNWVYVGNPGFTPGINSYTTLALDSSGNQYVVFQDVSRSSKATVMYALKPQAPGQVTGLTATAQSTSAIALSWTAPASNGTASISGYKIERESPMGGGFSTLVSSTNSTATSYTDTGLSAGTQYNYRVSAISADGTGTPSATSNNRTNVVSGGAINSQMLIMPNIANISFSINNGAVSTQNSNVTLNIQTGPDIKSMAVSNTAGFDGISIQPLSNPLPWSLCKSSCPSGKYTVYIKLYTQYRQSVTQQSSINYAPASGLSDKILTQPAVVSQVYGNSSSGFIFQKNLKLGMTSPDVKKLQQYLNSHGFIVSTSGGGSPGNETELFGSGTKKAVMAMQAAHASDILTSFGLSAPTGMFSQATRAFVNSHP